MEKQGNSEINKKSILSNKAILKHLIFFEKCSIDYKTKATHLMNKLALHLDITVNPSRPLESLQFLKKLKSLEHQVKTYYHNQNQLLKLKLLKKKRRLKRKLK